MLILAPKLLSRVDTSVTHSTYTTHTYKILYRILYYTAYSACMYIALVAPVKGATLPKGMRVAM